MSTLQLITILAVVAVTGALVYYATRRLLGRIVASVYAAIGQVAYEAKVMSGPRRPLPITSDGAIKPNERTTIKTTPRQPGFLPQRIFISHYNQKNNVNGAFDWVVHDIRVDGLSQCAQSGDIPGDMFASNAIDGFVRFSPIQREIELDVTYIGENKNGIPFYASVVGAAPDFDPTQMTGDKEPTTKAAKTRTPDITINMNSARNLSSKDPAPVYREPKN